MRKEFFISTILLLCLTFIWLFLTLIFSKFGLNMSVLIVAVIGGMLFSSLFPNLKTYLAPSLPFATKWMLRGGIVLYGLRLSLSELKDIGFAGFGVALFTVTSIMIFGILFGRVLKLDKKLTILISAGSAICGAAAVLATQSILKTDTDKTIVAVATVVVFGTIGMLLYPLVLSGLEDSFVKGLIVGGALHEVAHVVGAGAALGEEVAKNAIVVKMIRVMLLVPLLFAFAFNGREGVKNSIPWFALGFIGMICLNSLINVPFKEFWHMSDTFLLATAMSALGIQTEFKNLKKMGLKPFLLALMLMVVLALIGFGIWLIFN